jgi:hypothetical protein
MQHPNHRVVAGIRAVKALRFPSAFQSEEGQDRRQEELASLGVQMATSMEEAVAGVDAIFLEINDPSLHLPYYEQAVRFGLPIFIDKPLAATTAEGRRIRELADKNGVPTWSASSLRFIPMLAEARKAIPTPLLTQTFGALGKAAAGSDLVWYGVHAVEMLVAALGCGACSLRALPDKHGVTLLIEYPDNRRGLVECLRGTHAYGGRLQTKEKVAFFSASVGSPYAALMTALRDFVVVGKAPVPLTEAQEVLAILVAGERALATGGAVAVTP